VYPAAVLLPTRRAQDLRNGKRAIRFSPSLIVGGLIVLAFLVAAIAGPLLVPGQGELPGVMPRYGNGSQPEPPGPGHPLGLMPAKYDVLQGLIWGARLAIILGVVVTAGRVLIGVVLGVLSGYFGGLVDAVLMRLTDAFLAFPIIVAAMVGLVVLPLNDAQVVILAFILFGWMPYARLMRGNVLSAREREYMVSAKAVGLPNMRAIFRHLLPNATQGLSALLTSDIGGVMVLYAAFTFIGLIGTYSGTLMEVNWAQMLEQARDWIIGAPDKPFQYWYTYLPVSLAIVLFSVGWSLLGDGLQDVLDPRLR
jgi:peptide/nickel transport system permease protein